MSMASTTIIPFGDALLAAQEECQSRCLLGSSSMLGELMVSGSDDILQQEVVISNNTATTEKMGMRKWKRTAKLQALFSTATAYFQQKEYKRCHFTLTDTPTARNVTVTLGDLPKFLQERYQRRLQRRKSNEEDDGEETSGNVAKKRRNSSLQAVVALCQIDNQCAFLAAYALFMEGERAKHAESGGGGGAGGAVVAPAVTAASAAMAAGPTTATVIEMVRSSLELFPEDPYIWWLYGISSIRQARATTNRPSSSSTNIDASMSSPSSPSSERAEGIQALVTSIRLQPYFWSAYQDLKGELSSAAHLQSVFSMITSRRLLPPQLSSTTTNNTNNNTTTVKIEVGGQAEESSNAVPPPPVTVPPSEDVTLIFPQLFVASVHSSLHTPTTMEASIATLNQLLFTNKFPGNPYILELLGEIQNALENLHDAVISFAELHRLHPFALSGMDTYSHALYLLGDRLTHSVLAQEIFNVNPVSAQANVVVGNFFAAIRRHDQALLYLRRATIINPSLASAWTLLGHENISLKKTNAAADAYRGALVVNPRDYRAWFALGKIYTTHHMRSFALHYFQKAVECRPFDSRLWTALAECFQTLDRNAEKAQCMEQAELLEPPNTIRACQIARALVTHYSNASNVQRAIHFMQKVVASAHCSPNDLEIMLPRLVRHYSTLSLEYNEAALATMANAAAADAITAASSSSDGRNSTTVVSASSVAESSVAALKVTQQHCAKQATFFLHKFEAVFGGGLAAESSLSAYYHQQQHSEENHNQGDYNKPGGHRSTSPPALSHSGIAECEAVQTNSNRLPMGSLPSAVDPAEMNPYAGDGVVSQESMLIHNQLAKIVEEALQAL